MDAVFFLLLFTMNGGDKNSVTFNRWGSRPISCGKYHLRKKASAAVISGAVCFAVNHGSTWFRRLSLRFWKSGIFRPGSKKSGRIRFSSISPPLTWFPRFKIRLDDQEKSFPSETRWNRAVSYQKNWQFYQKNDFCVLLYSSSAHTLPANSAFRCNFVYPLISMTGAFWVWSF